MRSRRVCRLEKPCSTSVNCLEKQAESGYHLSFWREELKGEIIGIIWQSSNLVGDLLHIRATRKMRRIKVKVKVFPLGRRYSTRLGY